MAVDLRFSRTSRPFRQTAARASALEGATGHIFAESGARMAEMKCTPKVGHKKNNYVQRIKTLFRREDAGSEPV